MTAPREPFNPFDWLVYLWCAMLIAGAALCLAGIVAPQWTMGLLRHVE